MRLNLLHFFCFFLFLSVIAIPKGYTEEAPLTDEERFKRLENRLIALERRTLGKGKAQDSTLLADHEARLQAIEVESSKIYGTAEEVAHAVEKLAEKIELIVKDLELRLQDLEEGGVTPQFTEKKTAKKTRLAPQQSPTVEPVPNGIAAENLYNKAYGFMKKASFASAEEWFDVFTKRYPGHAKTENAYYWLGEVRLVRKDAQRALIAFGESIKKFPKGRRAPDSLLKMGVSFREIGKVELAKTSWEKLVKDFPKTPAAESAKKYLAQLK